VNYDYDLLVIGAGPGGLAAAQRAAAFGVRVAIAEQYQVGGTCVVHGCIPEKLMTYAAHFASSLRNADEYGWDEVQSRFNWARFIRSRNQEIKRLSELHIQHLKEAGVELIYGQASFLDKHALMIDNRKITAEKVLIAVGARDIKPQLPGIEHAITMRDMFHITQQPKHLIIIGGNHIAVKFAGVMKSLVAKVTQVVAEEEILLGFDQDLRTVVQRGMTKQGVEILSRTSAQAIERQQAEVALSLTGKGPDLIAGDVVVVADGQTPHLEGLNLDKVEVAVEQGMIAIDEYSRTSQPNIFAIGDCTPQPRWTPVATARGRAFAETEFGQNPQVPNYEYVPAVIASQPEAATVGLSEARAKEQFGRSVQCYCKTFQSLFNGIAESDQETLLKLVVDDTSGRVLGAHMVGECAGEIIQMVALAMKAGITKKDFDSAIGIHPSIGEEFFSLR
jgi:glutathione reductase (NADPH)